MAYMPYNHFQAARLNELLNENANAIEQIESAPVFKAIAGNSFASDELRGAFLAGAKATLETLNRQIGEIVGTTEEELATQRNEWCARTGARC